MGKSGVGGGIKRVETNRRMYESSVSQNGSEIVKKFPLFGSFLITCTMSLLAQFSEN